jgi:dihydroorotase
MLLPGHPRFFLGSDSAPHPERSKSTSTPLQGCAAGIYTSPILLPLVAHLLESFGALDKLEGFVSTFGRAFYKRGVDVDSHSKVVLQKTVAGKALIDDRYVLGDNTVVPFWAGRDMGWKIVSE